MNPTKPDTPPDRARRLIGYGECRCILSQYCDGTCRQIFENSQVRQPEFGGNQAIRQPWLCSCGSPSLPGVMHRADRPCYRVEENQSCD